MTRSEPAVAPDAIAVEERVVRRDRQWLAYLAELQEYAAQPQPLRQ
jgi:hypothetical protein